MPIIDSDIIINILRDKPGAIERLRPYDTADCAITAVNAMEILCGARNSDECVRLDRFLSRFSLLQIDPDISKLALLLVKKHAMSSGLHVADALIAASALVYKAELLTENKRHFRQVDGLVLR